MDSALQSQNIQNTVQTQSHSIVRLHSGTGVQSVVPLYCICIVSTWNLGSVSVKSKFHHKGDSYFRKSLNLATSQTFSEADQDLKALWKANKEEVKEIKL